MGDGRSMLDLSAVASRACVSPSVGTYSAPSSRAPLSPMVSRIRPSQSRLLPIEHDKEEVELLVFFLPYSLAVLCIQLMLRDSSSCTRLYRAQISSSRATMEAMLFSTCYAWRFPDPGGCDFGSSPNGLRSMASRVAVLEYVRRHFQVGYDAFQS